MNTLEAISTRRSIRKFKDGPIPPEDVKEILAAAMMAPSAGNAQPWQFVVVTDKNKLTRLKDINPHAAMAAQAPMGILVCGDLSLEKFPGYWVQDCSAAIQNMLLAAHAKGLGAVWAGIHPIAERVLGFKKMFGLPEPVIPLGFIVMGYPDQEMESKPRYKKERVHHETW